MRFLLPVFFALLMSGCGSRNDDNSLESLNNARVRLPDGTVIQAEIMRRPEEMMRGMMFRDSLAPDRGMLFLHGQPGNYSYWMYQVRIPLDMIWLDGNRRIVEIAAEAQPCRTTASQCPHYGGHQKALFVLELGGGRAAAHGLKLGDRLDF